MRIGIHTGLVVIGEIGAGGRSEQLALGETPNIAARIQGLADPNTVIISAATQRLLEGQFESQPFGSYVVKGLNAPIAVYHVQSERQQASSLAGRTTLTPLVGREQEAGLVLNRWEQAKEGRGQVVLLSGEPGIGKSRLAYMLREQVTAEGSLLFEARCSPYHQQSALYPLIDMWQRTLLFTRQDTDEEKVAKLERALALYEMPDTLPLLTALLSLPTPSRYPVLNFTPQKQKERTLQALLQLLLAQAERQATVVVWEDVHWADPSSLDLLTLLINQLPTTKLLLVLTFRPEFVPPWSPRSHVSQLVLNRLSQRHIEAMIEQAAAGHDLPAEVIEQIRVRTDGVPLFVEELTKSVVENLRAKATGNEQQGRQPGAGLGIPATLQDALMARLDRLSEARAVAQLGATLGREFSYELLHAVAPINAAELQTALSKLVEAEILYQRSVGEHARYFFKHALIQDTAYQSLLKNTRQQYHQQIAQVLEERFPDTKETQPELLAHHYTEAGLIEQAIPHWQSAGQTAVGSSAHTEAIRHLSKGLALLKTLPGASERDQHELTLLLALGTALQATKGMGAPETGATYARARELCQQIRETPQLFPVLFNLWLYSNSQAEYMAAATLGQQLLNLAEQTQDAALFLEAHHAIWTTAFAQGNFVLAREHLEQGHAIYHPQKHHTHAFLYGGHDPGVCGRGQEAWVLWMLGYTDQALKRTQASLTLAGELSHPMSLAIGLSFAANSHQFRREPCVVREHAEAVIALCSEQGFPFHLAWGTIMRGWALIEQGHQEEGIAQMRHGLAAYRATGAELTREYFLGLLAAGYRDIGQPAEGLLVLTEALAVLNKNGKSMWEAELYRLKGELTLQQARQRATGNGQQEIETDPRFLMPDVRAEAEACFLKAIEVARKQQAKSLELRATMSLARLWQQHDKKAEAWHMLVDVYNWFTEGFDTKDL